jgi:hypothetical protein
MDDVKTIEEVLQSEIYVVNFAPNLSGSEGGTERLKEGGNAPTVGWHMSMMSKVPVKKAIRPRRIEDTHSDCIGTRSTATVSQCG